LRSRFSLPDSQSATGGAYISQLCKRELYGYQLDCHDVSMPQKKSKTQSDEATRASVRKEMAKPRMVRSAKIAELNLDTSRTAFACAQNYYSFTTVAPFEAFRPDDQIVGTS